MKHRRILVTDLLSLFLSSTSQEVLWAPLAVGMYVTFYILDIAGLTVEGSFSLGAGIAAVSIMSGYYPLTACLLGFLGDAAAGLVSGLLHAKLKISAPLVEIIATIGLYSVTSCLIGAPSISLLGQPTIFRWVESFGITKDNAVLVVGLLFALIVVCLLVLFLRTETGPAIRVIGDNLVMSEANGIDTDNMKIIGYMILNGCTALSGPLPAQDSGFADLNSGIGTIAIELASIIIVEVLLRNQLLFPRLPTVVLGAVIYRSILALVSELNVEPSGSKLASAFVLVICLSFPRTRQKFCLSQRKKGGSIK